MSRIKVSLSILIFFSICLFQVFGGKREDWPFTHFGMFKGRISPQGLYRIDLFIINAEGKRHDVFSLGIAHYYVYENIAKILNGFDMSKNNTVITEAGELRLDSASMEKIQALIKSDILPKVHKSNLDTDGSRILLSYKTWENFSPQNADHPTRAITVFNKLIKDF